LLEELEDRSMPGKAVLGILLSGGLLGQVPGLPAPDDPGPAVAHAPREDTRSGGDARPSRAPTAAPAVGVWDTGEGLDLAGVPSARPSGPVASASPRAAGLPAPVDPPAGSPAGPWGPDGLGSVRAAAGAAHGASGGADAALLAAASVVPLDSEADVPGGGGPAPTAAPQGQPATASHQPAAAPAALGAATLASAPQHAPGGTSDGRAQAPAPAARAVALASAPQHAPAGTGGRGAQAPAPAAALASAPRHAPAGKVNGGTHAPDPPPVVALVTGPDNTGNWPLSVWFYDSRGETRYLIDLRGSPDWSGGVNVAVANITGGDADIIIGARANSSRVVVFNGQMLDQIPPTDRWLTFPEVQNTIVADFRAYLDPNNNDYRTGVFVAGGTFRGIGHEDVLTGTGPGFPTHVKAFAYDGQLPGTQLPIYISFFAYDPNLYPNGVTVAAGQVRPNALNLDDIVTAPATYSSLVEVWEPDGSGNVTQFAYVDAYGSGAGASVATGHTRFEDVTDVVTGELGAPGSHNRVRNWIYNGTSQLQWGGVDTQAYGGNSGTYVPFYNNVDFGCMSPVYVTGNAANPAINATVQYINRAGQICYVASNLYAYGVGATAAY
jgi:hypothetical protein